MLYGIIRILFSVGIMLLIMRLSGVRWKRLSGKLKAGIIIIWALIVTLLALIPFENLFVTFPSAEAVCSYSDTAKVHDAVYGDNSCLIISKKSNGSRTLKIIPKENGGYKIGTYFTCETVYSNHVERVLIKIFRAKNTDDYYLYLSGFVDNMDFKIHDNKSTDFTIELKSINDPELNGVDCYAFIGNIEGGYTLFIGDESLDISL